MADTPRPQILLSSRHFTPTGRSFIIRHILPIDKTIDSPKLPSLISHTKTNCQRQCWFQKRVGGSIMDSWWMVVGDKTEECMSSIELWNPEYGGVEQKG